jgi:hypothetical protein
MSELTKTNDNGDIYVAFVLPGMKGLIRKA